MSLQVVSAHRPNFQTLLFLERNRAKGPSNHDLQKTTFVLQTITHNKTLSRKNDEPTDPNFPKDKYWTCQKCSYNNLVNVFKCGICGKPRYGDY